MSAMRPSYADAGHSVRALGGHRFLFRLALAGVHVFAWVFIFNYFYFVEQDLARALARAALLYALSYTVVCLVTPLSARLLRGGARRVLIFGALLAAVALVVLGAGLSGFWGGEYAPLAVIGFALALGVYRALYWVPYEVEASAQARARSSLFREFFVALAPALCGIFIAASPSAPLTLLFMGAGVMALSLLPLYYLRDVHESYSWGYRETFQELLMLQHRPVVVHAFLEGISGAALLFFWPLAIFLITNWSYGMLGLVLSIPFLMALFLRAPVRALTRRARLYESRLTKIVFAVSPWLFRLLVATPLSIVLVDSYFYTTTPRRLGIDPFAFEQFTDGGSLMDEHTALKEIAQALGKIAVCGVGAFGALLLSVPLAFVAVFLLAALASAASALRR